MSSYPKSAWLCIVLTACVAEVDEVETALAVDGACGESTADRWFSAAVPERTGQLVAEVYARVHEAELRPVDMVLGFGRGVVDGLAELAASVRFDLDGRVHARDGEADLAETEFRFHYDHLYAVRFEIDIPSKTYSAYIRTYDTPGMGDPIAIDYAFRTEQSATDRLDGFAHVVDSDSGTLWGCVHDLAPGGPADLVGRTDLRY